MTETTIVKTFLLPSYTAGDPPFVPNTVTETYVYNSTIQETQG